MIKQLLHLARGGKKLDFNNNVKDDSFIIGEIFLGLIRFIFNYKKCPSKKLLINAVNLITFMSFFLKMKKDLSHYVLHKFYILNFTPLKNMNENPYKSHLIRQCHLFMANVLDKLETDKFYITEGFEVPEDHKIEEIFKGYPVYLEFDVLIIAKTIKIDKIRCKETQYVYQFIKEIQETEYLFEGLDLSPQGYWLFIECDEENVQDIPLNFDWTMRKVQHLIKWMKSFGKAERFKLVFKKRIWTIRYRLSLERFSSAKISGIFYEVKRMFLVKNVFKEYCKLDKLIKIAGILSLIEEIENNNKKQFIKSSKILVQKTIPESSQNILGEMEWIRRINNYLEKNKFLGNHSLISLKKQFLIFFLESPNYCSSFYSYQVEETNMNLGKEGFLSINIYGLSIFDKKSFEIPTYYFALEHIDTVLFYEDTLVLKFNEIDEDKIYKLKLKSVVKEDIAYDIISYMEISLKEPKKLFYAYNYISKFFPYGKYKNQLSRDSAVKPMVNKCKEEITRLRNIDIDIMDLAFSRKYNLNLTGGSVKGSFSVYKVRKEVDIELHLKKTKTKGFVEQKRASRSHRNSRVDIAGIMRLNTNMEGKGRGGGYSKSGGSKIDDLSSSRNDRIQKKIEPGDRKTPYSRSSVLSMMQQNQISNLLTKKNKTLLMSDSEKSDSDSSNSNENLQKGRPENVPRLNINGNNVNLVKSSILNSAAFNQMESIGGKINLFLILFFFRGTRR